MNKLSGFCTLNVNGEMVGFKFGMNAFYMFTEMHKQELAELDKILQKPTGIRDLIYCAHCCHAMSINQTPAFDNPYQTGDWIDEMQPEQLKQLTEAMMSARVAGVAIGDMAASKKKGKGQ